MNKPNLDNQIKLAQKQYAKLISKLKALEAKIYELTKMRYGR